MHATVSLLARILLAAIFIAAGWSKIQGYAGTEAYMSGAGVPAQLLPAVIALEIGGGVAILIGLFSRWAAFGLAIFSVVAAALFHNNFADQMQAAMFMKNLGLAGGLLLLSVNGPGSFAVTD